MIKNLTRNSARVLTPEQERKLIAFYDDKAPWSNNLAQTQKLSPAFLTP